MGIISRLKQRLKLIHNKLIHSNGKNQFSVILLLMIISCSWILTKAVHIYAANNDRLQEEMAEKIIRFHVIANSDSEEDQHLKYQVKDALVEAIKPYLKNAEDVEDAEYIVKSKLQLIESIASQVVEKEGYKYDVTAILSPKYFPMKVYGEYTFPPGNYMALQVRIGDAQGKNWWCLMFPPLCFVDETYNIVDEDGEEKLKELLTEEEFDALKNDKSSIKVKFKLLEAIKKLFE